MVTDKWPENKAAKVWRHDGVQFSIMAPGQVPNFCGFCRFETRPVKEPLHSGILTYAPVHGGITYAAEDKNGEMVYGFDCGHAGDNERKELRDLEWLGEECFRMSRAILRAAEFEDRYLATKDKERVAVLDEYHRALKAENINFELTDNFGAMINVLFGDI